MRRIWGVSLKEVAAVDRPRIQEIARRLEVELPGWKMHCVLTFGSTARDEAVRGSDVDLWFIGHSTDRIFLDKTWRQGCFAAGTEGFIAAHADLEVVEIDSWGDLQAKVDLTMPLVFGSPLADTRWLLWQLAEERDWQCLFFIITGEGLIDPDGFLSDLHEFQWRELPFHVAPDHGIVAAIKLACEREKFALLRDIALISGQKVAGPRAGHTVWLWPAIECIRDAVVLLSLIQEGKPRFRRKEVLVFIEQQFPKHLPVAEEIYRYKASEDGRNEWRELINSGSEICERELKPKTESILAFWTMAMAAVDRCLLERRSLIPFAGENWRESNHAAYERFYEEYIEKVHAL